MAFGVDQDPKQDSYHAHGSSPEVEPIRSGSISNTRARSIDRPGAEAQKPRIDIERVSHDLRNTAHLLATLVDLLPEIQNNTDLAREVKETLKEQVETLAGFIQVLDKSTGS